MAEGLPGTLAWHVFQEMIPQCGLGQALGVAAPCCPTVGTGPIEVVGGSGRFETLVCLGGLAL